MKRELIANISGSGACICLAVLLSRGVAAPPNKDYVERSDQRVRVKISGVSPSALSCSEVRDIAREIVRESPGRRLYIVRASDEKDGCGDGALAYHITYDRMLLFRAEAERRTGTCGEAIMTPAGDLVRIRSSSNAVTECTTGANPLDVTVGAKKVKLVWLFYWQPPQTAVHALKVFGTYEGDLSPAEAAEVFKAAVGRFPAAYLELDLRHAPWFPYDPKFPPYYVFGGNFEPPRSEQADLPPMISCSGPATSPRCEVHSWEH